MHLEFKTGTVRKLNRKNEKVTFEETWIEITFDTGESTSISLGRQNNGYLRQLANITFEELK